VLGGFILLNHKINSQINSISKKPLSPAESNKTTNTSKTKALKKKITQKSVTRTESKSPKNNYSESIFIVDGKEVARFKREDEKIFDVQGDIPDGKIEFVNKWKSTYGFEQFQNGKRDGRSESFYKNGQIQSKASYRNGRLLARKSYYHGGGLRMEEDYTNTSRLSKFTQDKFERVGRGKIYRLNGSIKYEWFITDDAKQYYTKRYNSRGEIVQENYYNTNGEYIKKEKSPIESHSEAETAF